MSAGGTCENPDYAISVFAQAPGKGGKIAERH
jgi:hypothetical protein